MFMNRSVLDWPTGVTVYKPDKCYNGYTVVNPFISRSAYLIDMNGRIVHTWQCRDVDEEGDPLYPIFVERQAGDAWMSLRWREPGKAGRLWPPHPQHSVAQLAWDGSVIWRYAPPDGTIPHHDVERLKNGNTLILMLRMEQLPHISERPMQNIMLVEVDPEGHTVWEWNAGDHFAEFGFSDEARRLMHVKGGDIFHDNTATVLPGNELEHDDSRFAKGNILASQRNTNLIYIIDKHSGAVVWKWGNGEDQLVGQHHPTMLQNGNILIYDNGGQAGYPVKYRFNSRLLEIDPLTEQTVWEYGYEYYQRQSSKFLSSSWGSAQRLPNGNTFSLDTHKGRLFEVTPYGEIVWEYISPFPWGTALGIGGAHRNQNLTKTEYGMYRAFRYGYDEVPQVDPEYRGRDGYAGVSNAPANLPPRLGLPSADLP